MGATPTYPGVYIEEIPSGVHTIVGVATSITAFVGRAQWGWVNEPQTINSWSDYERYFGGLSLLSTMSYAVSDFYANGGSQAIIVRLANGGQEATVALPENLSPPPSPVANPGLGPYQAVYLTAASVGSWGNNLAVSVDLPQTGINPDPTIFNMTVKLYDPTNTRVILQERYLNISVDPTEARYVGRVLQQSSNLVLVSQNSANQDEVPLIAPAAGTYWAITT
jgi:uncharacterized protein